MIHVHTTYSRDGLLTPLQVAGLCRDRGLSFVVTSDHAEDVSEERMEAMVSEWQSLSDNAFVMIPGLEHRLTPDIHLLSLGQTAVVPPGEPAQVIARLRDQGCTLAVAHYRGRPSLPDDIVSAVDAVEVWNVAHDTRYTPTNAGLRAYKRLLERNPILHAVGGLDLHSGREWGCELCLDLPTGAGLRHIVSAVRRGDFTLEGRYVSLSSRPVGGSFGSLLAIAGDAFVRVRTARNAALAAIGVQG